MHFSFYRAEQLKTPSYQLNIGPYLIEFKAFSQKENRHKTPVVFLGGAFQTFSSFRVEVERALLTHPVLLVDLPSQGRNPQLAPELSLEDYADLLNEFLTRIDLARVMLVGLSYGSVMALLFAAHYPNRVQRLMLSGITCFRRPELLTALNDSMQLLKAHNMEAYATAALGHLINHNHLADTGVNTSYRRMLYRQISRLSDNEKQRHWQNTQRLMDFTGFTHYPSCPTLIAAGEFDNFTQPHENAGVAARCANAHFAIIENADHLAQLEQKDTTTELFARFINEQPIYDVQGVRFHNPRHYQPLPERQTPLIENPHTHVQSEDLGMRWGANIDTLDCNECVFTLAPSVLPHPQKDDRLVLDLPEMGMTLMLAIIDGRGHTLRGIILHRDIESLNALAARCHQRTNRAAREAQCA